MLKLRIGCTEAQSGGNLIPLRSTEGPAQGVRHCWRARTAMPFPGRKKPQAETHRLGNRQIDLDDQSTAGCVHRADGSSMNLNGAFGDGESQPGPFGISIVDSPEREENVEQHVLRHSRPAVPHTKQYARILGVK